jgi:antitoxin component HigA of HigAB toxin-antitoxin module
MTTPPKPPTSSPESPNTDAPDTPPQETPPPAPVEHIFRWDLDKTYLQTDFDRVRDLVRTAFQKAEDKKNVPGAIPLLRALIQQTTDPTARRALYIVSGSPTQMRKVLERKLALDGIHPDAFVLKPNLENLIKFRFRALRAQVGYKLRAMLEHQVASSPRPIPETLFGDDAEQDAIIYAIYAEVVAGRIRGDALQNLLTQARVYPHNLAAIMAASDLIPPADRVRRIFIRLDRKSPPERFKPFQPLLVAVYNYFQAALVLFQDGLITAQDVIDISLHMIANDNYNIHSLSNSLQDILRRRALSLETVASLSATLHTLAHQDETARSFLTQFAEQIDDLPPLDPSPQPPPPPDYAELLRRELAAHRPQLDAPDDDN